LIKKIIFLSLIFLITLCVCLCVGRYPISLINVTGIFLTALGIENHNLSLTSEMMVIFWKIRVPRIILTIMVGGAISTAGAVFQAVFRNPLAAPDILGVTAGSSFGAAMVIMFFIPIAFIIQASAFIFGITAVLLAYILASFSRDKSPSVLVISGIVISAVFQAGLSFFMYIANPYDQLSQIIFWTMGSFHTASWPKIQMTMPVIVPGILLLTAFSWRLNIMTQDQEDAMSMGVNIVKWRIFYIFISTLMVASSVAIVGAVAWIGLIVPHIARYIVGPEHRKLIPASAFLGGIFLMIMDTIARSIILSEIPISIVTSIFGAPFLGYLVMTTGKGRLGHESAC
jgi:iron complex transport system permease protein